MKRRGHYIIGYSRQIVSLTVVFNGCAASFTNGWHRSWSAEGLWEEDRGRRTECRETCTLVLVCLAHRLDGRGLRHASRKDLR